MNDLIHQLPKAELHMHLEGSLEPDLMFDLAKRNHIALPFATVDDVRRAYSFTNLQSFLDIYYRGAGVLVSEDDFYRLTMAWLQKARDQNIRHAEIMFDPQTHTDRGIPLERVIHGICRALDEVETPGTLLILCFLRHLPPESAMTTLEQALPFIDRITAVGLDSSERGFPPRLFRQVFDEARRHGFLTVAHAGEEGPPEYIHQALDLLGAARIDHGVRCIEDPQLVERLEREQIPLTVCPLSNVKLCVYSSLQDPRFRHLMDTNLLITLNSDDPAYFGGYLEENYRTVAQALEWDGTKLCDLAANSFRASFLGEKEKAGFLAEIGAIRQHWWEQHS